MWTVKGIFAAIATLVSTASPLLGQELKDNAWSCTWCVGVSITRIPSLLGGGFSFNFPLDVTGCPDPNYRPFANRTARSTCNAVHYVTTPRTQSLMGRPSLTMVFSITGNAPIFDACVEGDLVVNGVNQCYPNPGAPPNCRFFIEHNNDQQITNPGYRWWSQTFTANGAESTAWPLELVSEMRFTVSLDDLTKWSDVNGQRADQEPNGLFNDTKLHPSVVGFTCSGIFSYGHGVRLTSGSAKWTMKSYTVD